MGIRFVPLLGGLPATEKVLASAVLVGLPVFFSGLVFSRSFRDVERPAQGLGINLLGAVAGGMLENLVMVSGTTILGLLAMSIDGVSAAALTLFDRGNEVIWCMP